MTTIVRHKRTGNEYILLGINGEENKTNPSRFINELFSQSQAKSEMSCSATVCDVQGNLFLAYIDDLIVIEIDGNKPSDILPEPEYRSAPNDYPRQQVRDFGERPRVLKDTAPHIDARRKGTRELGDRDFVNDEELEDEDFDDEEDKELEDKLEDKRVIITPQPESPPYSQDAPNKSDFDDEDEDWI